MSLIRWGTRSSQRDNRALFVLLVLSPPRLHPRPQTDSRSATIEVKIKKLDGELVRYKEQMSKLRNGPGKVGVCSFFLAAKLKC